MILRSIVVLIVCAATICFFNYFPQFDYFDNELLSDPNFSNGLSNWMPSEIGVEIQPTETRTHSGDSANLRVSTQPSVTLSAPDFDHAIHLSQAIPLVPTGSLLHVSSYIKTLDVIEGARPWETARIVLLAYDHFGKAIYNQPHLLISKNGTSDWTYHERVFRVNENTTKLQLIIQLIHAKGQLEVKSPSIRQVKPNIAFERYRCWFIAIWTCLGLWIAFPLVCRAAQSRNQAAILVIGIGILAGVLMPQAIKEYIGDMLWSSADMAAVHDHGEPMRVFKLTTSLPELDKYKYGHFVMFALLCVAASKRSPFNPPIFQTVQLTILFAVATEVLQLFVPGRGPQLGDIIIDTAGIFTGSVLSMLSRLKKH
ncbi:VanZ family protein [Methylomonas sp. EFPC3]|uniref:VanZ family protein n=1 Tax=Methylomonas sp. EFPC3 TaxID=3021710 RepID=UPI002416AFCC|nr:VanZ family protein [Methylomonas sp. EFPC3]WFP49536.1 VanZ family protein [Methylomonas sp. EFPC3]